MTSVEWLLSISLLLVFNLAISLDSGSGVAAPDYPAAVDWYKRAADSGLGEAANSLCTMYTNARGRAWQVMPASSSSSFETLVT